MQYQTQNELMKLAQHRYVHYITKQKPFSILLCAIVQHE